MAECGVEEESKIKNNYEFLRAYHHQHHNLFRLRPGQAESCQPPVADPGEGASGAGCGRGLGHLPAEAAIMGKGITQEEKDIKDCILKKILI